MDGSADVSWLDEEHVKAWRKSGLRCAEGDQGLPARGAATVGWCHERHGVVLPMPTKDEEAAMWLEVQRSQPETELGSVCQFWLARVNQWLKDMVQRFQRNDGKVTGNWAWAYEEWSLRLSRVRDGRELQELLQIIKEGGRLPFSDVPSEPIRRFRNHPNLAEKPAAVWATVDEQLSIGAVVPFDVQGAVLVDGSQQRGGVLPRCMFSSRWVQKGASSKVRVTCNGGPLKPFFAPEAVACVLDTNEAMRHLWREGDLFVSFDQCTSF